MLQILFGVCANYLDRKKFRATIKNFKAPGIGNIKRDKLKITAHQICQTLTTLIKKYQSAF